MSLETSRCTYYIYTMNWYFQRLFFTHIIAAIKQGLFIFFKVTQLITFYVPEQHVKFGCIYSQVK